MAPKYMAVGIALRRAREGLGKTQQQIADELGKKQPQIVRWESGETPPMTADVLAVAKAYGIRPQRILALAKRAA